MDDRLRRQYLEAMGIPQWERRLQPAPPEVTAVEDSAGMESGPTLQTEPASTSDGVDTPSAPRPSPKDLSSPSAADEPPPWLSEAPPIMEESYPLTEEEQEAPQRTARSDVFDLDWAGLEQRVAACKACELHRTRTQTVFGVGNRQADLMVIGEAPGADEDRQGEPFVGRAGQLLNAMLLAIGFKREEVFIANILKCRPPGNRDPQLEEALHCEPYLLRQVELVAPRAILAVGRIAAQNLLKSEEAVGRLRGRVHRFGEKSIPLVVSYHPAYLLRSPEQKAKAWQDLQQVMSLLRQA